MYKTLLPMALLCLTLSSVQADDRGFGRDGRGDFNRENRDFRDLRACQIRNDILQRDNQSLNDKLNFCQTNQGNLERAERLERENRELIDQVEKLKIDNARLDMEAHPDRGGHFSLAASIMACSKIDNAVYAQQCRIEAKNNSIQASLIEQCSRLSNTYYALECVKSVGGKEIGARQVESCLQIDNVVYALQCVQVVGEKRISSDIITSCIKTSTNSYYQLECIKNM